MPRFGLVVDLAPWPQEAGRLSVDLLAAPLRRALGSVRFWRLAAEDGDPKGAGAVRDPQLAAVILSGSAAFVEDPPRWLARLDQAVEDWTGRGVPLLGTCFGHQFLAHRAGGRLARYARPRQGLAPLQRTSADDPLAAGVGPADAMLWSHRDYVAEPPPGAILLAASTDCGVEMFRLGDRPVWGLQAHPEGCPALAEAIAREDRDEGQALRRAPWSAYATAAGGRILANFAAWAAAHGPAHS